MQNIDIRNKHYIYCRKIILALILLCHAGLFAQRNVMENDLKFARKPYHFGIHLASGFGDFKIKHGAQFATSDSILSIKSKYDVNFEIAALISYHINKYVELRTMPGFLFSNKSISYEFGDATFKKKSTPQVYFDLPVEIKIKSEPLKDIKLYMVAGLKYGYDVGSNFKDRRKPDQPIQKPNDFGVNYGVGIEIHFPLFILSPEFKMYNSFLNIHQGNDALPYSKYIKGLYNRNFIFSINFEG